MRCAIVLVLGLFIIPRAAPVSHNTEIVRKWAEQIGEELWNLTSRLTNINDIKRRYDELHIKVKTKNETSILNSAVESVGRMLQRKIDAVKCIHHQAEQVAREFDMELADAQNFSYCSSKYSYFEQQDFNGTQDDEERPECAKENAHHYENVSLNEDSHFYDIAVNTDRSCVQVPTNIYDQERDALEAIMWSEQLDDTFKQNYESDPSLSWQYFGSSTGILRFFPGMPWNKKDYVFDCRVRSWYIEAATCSKDVIVLFDVSGSMTGFRNYVARATLHTILDTLSNNDYVNVYYFKDDTRQAVPCFSDLVQATPENLLTITEALEPTEGGKKHKVLLEGYANLTTAYITAFEKLKERRENCSTDNQGCNQLVMLITDYVPGNLTEVFETYNREMVGGETRIPVRVFTYLIGKEVTNVREIQWMACLNRGYYVHIHSIEEVQQQVLEYINVIARPMILEGEEPPPTWTHAYIDETRTNKWGVSKQTNLPDADKLVTSVAIPAFKFNYNVNKTKAELLGVAGTDVPIDSIAKLAQPHQLGVNGYSFIVSNNGYVLLHPSLVPSINGRLQVNLNSVDLVEVEQVDDNKDARELGEEIQALRTAMVQGESGNLSSVPVLYHYDRMRRIAEVRQNYFYNKLLDTPFSLGISLPADYGKTYLDVGDIWEVDFGKYSGVSITDYFNSSFRVHPDWVYCKYHYLEGHEMETPEKEVWHFLRKMSHVGWKWSEQYRNDTNSSHKFSVETHCTNRTTLDKDDYYCNKDLVQMLVFDAKLTDPFFKKWVGSRKDFDMAKLYDATVRFISTSSGLTRWHYIQEDGKNELVNDAGDRKCKGSEYEKAEAFGDTYPRAIEEVWYMSAVLQHVFSDETIVVAVNFTADNNTSDNITVTASYAIFARELNEESPASVVGIQFQYNNWRERFERITNNTHIMPEPFHSKLPCPNCIESCRDDSGVQCYLIDSSGYIVLSENPGDVGKFFGLKEPFVMINFVNHEIFNKKDVYDYQALCGLEDLRTNITAASCRFGTPFTAMNMLGRWLLTQLLWLMNDVILVAAEQVWSDDDDYFEMLKEYAPPVTTTEPPPLPGKNDDTDTEEELFSCDKQVNLFILQPEKLIGGTYEKERAGNCTPPYTAVTVKHTNLLFVAVDTRGFAPLPVCPRLEITTKPKPTLQSTENKIPCHKLPLGKLKRRRLEGCYTYHKKEEEIDDCGDGSRPARDMTLLTSAALLAVTRFLLR